MVGDLYRTRFLICLSLICHVTVSGEVQATRGINFDDRRPGYALDGKSIATHSRSSQIRCANLCSLQPDCVSYNYYMTRVCQLNSGDVFSKNAELPENLASTYFGMKRDGRPRCVEKGREKDIMDDGTPNFCYINLKRQDAVWNEWVDVFAVDTTEEWKKVKQRTCVPGSHGGLLSCEGTSEEILEHYLWVHALKNWDDADLYCRSRGGSLVSNINGTRDQIKFFVDKALHSQRSNHWSNIAWLGNADTRGLPVK